MMLKATKIFCSLQLLRLLKPTFAQIDFDLAKPTSSFNDNGATLDVELDYVIGADINSGNTAVKIMETGCDNDAAADAAVLLSSTAVNTPQLLATTTITKGQIASSGFLTEAGGAVGASQGTLDFCVMVEVTVGGIEVSFLKENVSVSYDLTTNSFSVDTNAVEAFNIETSQTQITNVYQVDACRCTETVNDYSCDGSPGTLQQNGLVSICILPNSTDVSISNFDMRFEQEGLANYEIVSIGASGPTNSPLTAISGDGGATEGYKVTSRLISQMFEVEDTTFDVKGNAYLEFARRRLTDSKTNLRSSNSRSLEEAPVAGESAGEAPFEMEVGLEQPRAVVPKKSNTAVISLAVIGGCAALSIAFLLAKKFKK